MIEVDKRRSTLALISFLLRVHLSACPFAISALASSSNHPSDRGDLVESIAENLRGCLMDETPPSRESCCLQSDLALNPDFLPCYDTADALTLSATNSSRRRVSAPWSI